MRFLPVLLLSAALTASPAFAADISYDGAKQLQDKLNAYLPDDLAKAGVLTVRPGTTDYEISFDAMPIVKKFDPATVTINGLKPFLSLLRPQDDGTFKVSQQGNLDISGFFTAKAEKTDFSYKIDSFRSDGIYDPDLIYFRSAEMEANQIRVTTQSTAQKVDVTSGKMSSVLTSEKVDGQKINIQGTTMTNGFSESVFDAALNQHVDINAEALQANFHFNGLAYKPVQDAVFFLLDKKNQKTLNDREQARLKEIARANLPLFDSLTETVDVRRPKVTADYGEFGAQALTYSIDSNGLRDGARLSIGLSLTKPEVPAGLIPPAYMAALPDSVTTKFSFENFNLASGIQYFLDHADFNAAETLTKEQTDEAGKIFLPDGALTIRYDDITAKSAVYDVSLTGMTTIYPAQQGRQNTDVTLYAKDFDKTLAYLQKNAKAVPEFGQAAFFMMMAKGFAETASDGRQMWRVIIDDNKQVSVNGQQFPMGR